MALHATVWTQEVHPLAHQPNSTVCMGMNMDSDILFPIAPKRHIFPRLLVSLFLS